MATFTFTVIVSTIETDIQCEGDNFLYRIRFSPLEDWTTVYREWRFDPLSVPQYLN
jgi:hypothetical protein